jgi:hypothetical protein
MKTRAERQDEQAAKNLALNAARADGTAKESWWARQQARATAAATAKSALKVVNTRGGVAKEILHWEARNYELVSQTRSTTGKTSLTFRSKVG